MLKTLAALALLFIVSLPGAAQAGGVFIAFPFPFIFPFPFFGAPFFPPPAFFPPPPAFFPPPPAFSPQPAAFQPQAAPTATTPHPAATTHATGARTAHTCRIFNGDATVDGTQQPFFGTACLGADKKWHIQQP